MSPDKPPTTNSPSVEPSDPEIERQVLEHAHSLVKENSTRKYIGLSHIRDILLDAGLDIDDSGFIVTEGTSDYAIPYAHSRTAFREIESPVDDPFDAYYRPEFEVDVIISDHERIHLSDLHAVKTIDGAPRPIRSHAIALSTMLDDTGFLFGRVAAWSSCSDMVEHKGKSIKLLSGYFADNPIEIGCINCGFRSEPGDWNGETETDPVCPSCEGRWKSSGTFDCEKCGSRHWFDELDFRVEAPSCPDCDADYEHLSKRTRYVID